jgi:hypothetical protein
VVAPLRLREGGFAKLGHQVFDGADQLGIAPLAKLGES